MERVQTVMVRAALIACFLLLVGHARMEAVGADDIVRLQAGVVKITAKPPSGTANTGTGFIVRMDKDATYIVTAAHVVAGDQHPRVEFFTKRNVPVAAEVLGLEGDDEVRGLALLVVRGQENIPNGLMTLSLATTARYSGGEDIIVIGFPRSAGPWAVIKGNVSSRQGRDIYFSPAMDSGHSGGPIIQNGKTIGLVGGTGQLVGRGITSKSLRDFVEGFGITFHEESASKTVDTQPEHALSKRDVPPIASPTTPKRPSVAASKQEPLAIVGRAEMKAHDLTPMVLVPAGGFLMGSENGDQEIRPIHVVHIDDYYIDKFEVTVGQYERFLGATARKPPRHWEQIDLNHHRDRPVVGVDWEDAQAYCAWTGKRLPSEAEWEKAAKGSDGRIYPWGNESLTTKKAKFGQCCEWKGYELLNDVSSNEEGKSPYGVYNLAGNVREWTLDWYDGEYYSKSPSSNPRGPEAGGERVIRGGSWANSNKYLQTTNRDREQPSLRSSTIGFRCVRETE
jgi:formylglycine-generating enzyme required for sulfatase activity